MSAQVAADLEAVANVLAQHYRESTGMSYGSPDRCACGTETRPPAGDDDVTIRRARAFGYHQAEQVIAVLRATTEQAGVVR